MPLMGSLYIGSSGLQTSQNALNTTAHNLSNVDCVLKDEITCIGECNPLHGPRVEALIQILEEGRTPEKFSYVEEGLYAHDDTVTAVTVGDKTYQVRRVDDEIRNENAY